MVHPRLVGQLSRYRPGHLGLPEGEPPLVLAMLAVALVFVGATHGWVPALSQREGSLDLSATFLLGWCIGLTGLTLARRRKPRP